MNVMRAIEASYRATGFGLFQADGAKGSNGMPPRDHASPRVSADTQIKTQRGEIRVGDFKPGIEVLTRDAGYMLSRRVGNFRMTAEPVAPAPQLAPVRIRAGALDLNQPKTDLIVGPGQRVSLHAKPAMRLAGKIEVPGAAQDLRRPEGIDRADGAMTQDMTVRHFTLDTDDLIFTDGAATESPFTKAGLTHRLGSGATVEIATRVPDQRGEALGGASAFLPSSTPLGRALDQRETPEVRDMAA